MTGLIVKSGSKNALDGYQVSEAFDEALDTEVAALSEDAAAEPKPMTAALSNHVISSD